MPFSKKPEMMQIPDPASVLNGEVALSEKSIAIPLTSKAIRMAVLLVLATGLSLVSTKSASASSLNQSESEVDPVHLHCVPADENGVVMCYVSGQTEDMGGNFHCSYVMDCSAEGFTFMGPKEACQGAFKCDPVKKDKTSSE